MNNNRTVCRGAVTIRFVGGNTLSCPLNMEKVKNGTQSAPVSDVVVFGSFPRREGELRARKARLSAPRAIQYRGAP